MIKESNARKDIGNDMIRKNKKGKFLVILLSLLYVSLSLGACAKKDATANKAVQLTDFDSIEQEYLDYMKKLSWPEGFSLPTKLEGEVAEEFQVGYGETRASMLWECAWQKEWLQFYKTDSNRAKRALDELEKAPDMHYMSPQKCDDATREYFKDNLNRAKLGDPSGFEENIRLNCPS